MAGLAPRLPLRRDRRDGYGLIKSFEELARQNLKMLILTSPGERMMDPEFGVGLKRYLFEQNTPGTYGRIEANIRAQTSNYLPYIQIRSVNFQKPEGRIDPTQILTVSVDFFVTPLRIAGSLSFDMEWNMNI